MKKNRTRDQGLALARAYRSSGLTLREYSKKNGVTECSVQYWCQQFRQKGQNARDGADAQFIEVKAVEVKNVGAAKVKVGVTEVSFSALPEASWMSEFIMTVNRYV